MTVQPPDEATERRKADEKAAIEQVEPNRLLAGEDEGTPQVDDAVHWVKVYLELLEFKRSVLVTTEEHVGTMDPDAGVEVQKTDLKALHAEAIRFLERYYPLSPVHQASLEAAGTAG
jgi:hypothetical protein